MRSTPDQSLFAWGEFSSSSLWIKWSNSEYPINGPGLLATAPIQFAEGDHIINVPLDKISDAASCFVDAITGGVQKASVSHFAV